MADNDGTATPAVEHEPPSQPASPDPKRVKSIDPAPPVTSVAAILQDRDASSATPTPALPSHIHLPHPSTMQQSSTTTLPSLPPMASLPGAAPAAEPPLEVKLLSPNAQAPTKGSSLAAGYDIYASADTAVPARGKALVDTDISIAVPGGTYGRIAPRSGLASKHSIDCGAGVIDADYRGPLKVLLFNFSDADFGVKRGDRVAQLILERILSPPVVIVQELSETARGVGGFGSTGGFGVVAPATNGAA